MNYHPHLSSCSEESNAVYRRVFQSPWQASSLGNFCTSRNESRGRATRCLPILEIQIAEEGASVVTSISYGTLFASMTITLLPSPSSQAGDVADALNAAVVMPSYLRYVTSLAPLFLRSAAFLPERLARVAQLQAPDLAEN